MFFFCNFKKGEASGEAFIQLDSEEAATLTALNRHRRPMTFANKKRIIDVIQCSGDDMSYVLTNGVPPMPLPALPPTALPATAIPAQPSPLTMSTLQRPILSPGNFMHCHACLSAFEFIFIAIWL